MARDALAVMAKIGWTCCHIVGHSMGGMIAAKLAALRVRRRSCCGGISPIVGQ